MKTPKGISREAIERLRALIYSTKEFEPHLRASEPDWAGWVADAKLSPDSAEALVTQLRRAWLLPFADVQGIADLLVFQHTRLGAMREKFRQQKNDRAVRLCALFELLVTMALQGNSLCPQNPVHLARLAQLSLESPTPGRDRLDALLELFVDEKSATARTGNNASEAADFEIVLKSEHERREGLAEQAWKAPHKFTEYRQSLLDNPEFHADWATITRHFEVARWRDSRGIIRRSRLPERNWQRPTHPDLGVTTERFQVVFDFFCWKWFLYGMRDDDPLLEKLTHTLTPFGTQVFIPGYWNFDPARDINWKAVTRLHRARGLEKQGSKLTANKHDRALQLQRLKAADTEARKLRLRGRARYDFLKSEAGLAPLTDDAQVRRMLR
ncbi:MAG: hypothetical protein ABMA26_27355 [Limisphaerales bacterium]